MTLQKSFDNWCRELVYLKNRSPKTLRSYRQAFQSLQSSLPEEASGLTKAELQAWVVGMRERGLSPGACNVYIRAMNSFCSWLSQEQGLPLMRLQILSTAQSTLQTYNDSHIRLILSFKPRTFSERRILTLVLLLLDTGCRVDECIGIQRSQLDLDNLLLTVNGKGSKERKVPISSEARKILFRYMKLDDGHRIFGKLNYRNAVRDFKKLKVKLGLPEQYAFHQLRHTWATQAIRHGMPLPVVQRILGHSSILVTQKYVHMMTDDLTTHHLSPLSRLGK